jgi:argininosuccinate lyase
MALSLPHVAIDREKALAQVSDGSTQATDLAEALVKKGVPFREAYKAVGAAVKKGLSSIAPADVHPACDAECLAVLDPVKAMRAKTSQGGTAPERVKEQLASLATSASDLEARARSVPDLDRIAETIRAEAL